MSYGKYVGRTLGWIGESGHRVIFRRVGKCFHSTCEHFMHIALVRHIVDNLVLRIVKHIMQRNRHLHHAQIRANMAAVPAEFHQKGFAYFTAYFAKLIYAEGLYVRRRLDFGQLHFYKILELV